MRLIQLAYPTAPGSFLEQLAIIFFIDGLVDAETQRALRLAHPKNLYEALARALEFETAKQTSNGHALMRNLDAQDNGPELLEETIRRVLK